MGKKQKTKKKIIKQLIPYTGKIEELFLKICHFLGSNWSKQTPFKVMLYPIPLKQGHTTAIPKGNGWSYQQINGKMDTQEWYDNEYINGFAHEIYPSITQYLDTNKVIDKEFVQTSHLASGIRYPQIA